MILYTNMDSQQVAATEREQATCRPQAPGYLSFDEIASLGYNKAAYLLFSVLSALYIYIA